MSKAFDYNHFMINQKEDKLLSTNIFVNRLMVKVNRLNGYEKVQG